METIYWIQRLGTIHTIAWAFFWIGLFAAIIGFLIACNTIDEWCNTDEEDAKLKKIFKRTMKTVSCIACVLLLIGIFIPSEKDLYVIYGVGGTIDYVKSNDTAKQLPDKVVNALDAWIDNQTEKNKE